MSRNALAFIAGLGTGYLTQSERNKDRERQAKKDAQDDEIHAARMTDIRDKQREKAALADAGAERTAVSGTAVDTGAGKNLYTDPEQATAAAEDASIEADMRGQDPAKVTVQSANGITGKMATGHKITTDPVDLGKLNSPEARHQRTAAALYGLGKPVEAMQLEAGAKTAKLADIQLSDAQWKSDIGQAMQGGHEGLARLITTSQAGIMNGVTLNVVPSADGKTVTYNKVAPDGTVTPGMTFPNDQNGVIQAGYMLDKAITPEHRMDHYLKVKQADQTQGNWDKTHALAVDAKAETKRHNMALEGLYRERATKSGSGAGPGTEPAAFNPLGNFDAKKAQDVAFTQASKTAEARAAEGKPMSEKEQAILGQKLYRELEDQFAGENTRRHVTAVVSAELRSVAADPVAYAATYEKARKVGMDDKQLAGMGFKPPAAPANSAAAPGVARPVIPAPAPVPAAAPAAQEATPKKLSTVDQLQADNIAALAPLAAQYKQAEQQMVQAAKSGDQLAIARYMQAKEGLRAQLEKQVVEKFGNTAPAVLKQLYAQ